MSGCQESNFLGQAATLGPVSYSLGSVGKSHQLTQLMIALVNFEQLHHVVGVLADILNTHTATE